jgi:hypothetical protein
MKDEISSQDATGKVRGRNDEPRIRIGEQSSFDVSGDARREEALKTLRQLRVTVPENFEFSRDEIYGR